MKQEPILWGLEIKLTEHTLGPLLRLGEEVASLQAHVLGQKLFALAARNLSIYLGVCWQLFFFFKSQSWLKHSSSTFPV